MGIPKDRAVKHIVILGANGQLGNSMYQYLKRHFPEARITACVRQLPENSSQDYLLFDPFARLWQRLGNADVLINCIGIIKETKAFSFKQAHEGITRRILLNRQQMGMPKIIQISALGASLDSPAAFLATKAKADQQLLMSPNTVVVRPSIVCTPATMLAQKLALLSRISRYLMHCLPFPEHLLQTRIQPILAEDLAAVAAKLCFANQHPDIIHAVGPEEISLQELITMSDEHLSLLPVSKALADPILKFLAAIYPGLLNRQQYELLLRHNTACKQAVEQFLGRSVQSTKSFWRALKVNPT